MKGSALFGAALALGLPVRGLAQTSVTNKPAILELRLQPESVQKQIPHALSVLLINRSDHEVRLPMPSLACADVPHGTIRLHVSLKHYKASRKVLDSGCFNDFGYQPILERLKQWKALGPGESIVLMNESVLAHEAGVYEYWASYIPPGMSEADEQELRNAGIDFPQSDLESPHVSLVKAH